MIYAIDAPRNELLNRWNTPRKRSRCPFRLYSRIGIIITLQHGDFHFRSHLRFGYALHPGDSSYCLFRFL